MGVLRSDTEETPALPSPGEGKKNGARCFSSTLGEAKHHEKLNKMAAIGRMKMTRIKKSVGPATGQVAKPTA